MSTRSKTTILFVLILIFLAITLLIVNKNISVINFDAAVKTFIESHQSPSVIKTMLSITKIGNFFEAFIIFIVFGLFLWLKNKKFFYCFFIATSLGTLMPWLIKIFTQRVRPDTILLGQQGFSFPSGHATIATVFLLSSIFLLAQVMKKKFSRNVFMLATSIIFPLVAFSRIYLSVHWTTDVIAGIILGAICFVFSQIVCCQKKENVL